MSTTFVGRLVRDPKTFNVNSRQKVLFTLAVDRNYTDDNGDRPADFPPIAAWNGLGQICAKHLSKGRLVAVECNYRSYVSEKNDKKEYGHEFVADSVRFLDAPPQNQQAQPQQGQQPAPQGNYQSAPNYQANPNYQPGNPRQTAPQQQQQTNQAQYQSGTGNYKNVPF